MDYKMSLGAQPLLLQTSRDRLLWKLGYRQRKTGSPAPNMYDTGRGGKKRCTKRRGPNKMEVEGPRHVPRRLKEKPDTGAKNEREPSSPPKA